MELKKTFYGLKQAPRSGTRSVSFMTGVGYHKAHLGHYVFIKRCVHADFIIILLYVNDICSKTHKMIALLTKALSKSSAIKDLGPTMQIVGMRISHDRSGKLLCLSQERHIAKVVEMCNMKYAKSFNSLLVGHQNLTVEQ